VDLTRGKTKPEFSHFSETHGWLANGEVGRHAGSGSLATVIAYVQHAGNVSGYRWEVGKWYPLLILSTSVTAWGDKKPKFVAVDIGSSREAISLGTGWGPHLGSKRAASTSSRIGNTVPSLSTSSNITEVVSRPVVLEDLKYLQVPSASTLVMPRLGWGSSLKAVASQ
jgi:hypothetical protein